MKQQAVLLNEIDSAKFMLFMEHYDNFSLFLERGVFSIRNGSATIHFDNNGSISSIDRKDILYSKRHI